MVPLQVPYSTGKGRIETELRGVVCLLPHVTCS
jgi:hypothetical protein